MVLEADVIALLCAVRETIQRAERVLAEAKRVREEHRLVDKRVRRFQSSNGHQKPRPPAPAFFSLTLDGGRVVV
jgi:hypothetical protein